jgi:hypothetical protein
MTIKNETTHLNNLRKIINISEKIDIIMKQSLKLMDIVTENQKTVSDLKAEQIKLEGDK